MQMPQDAVTFPLRPKPPAELTSSMLSLSDRTSVRVGVGLRRRPL